MNIIGFIQNRLSDRKSQKQKTEEWAKIKLGRACRMKDPAGLDSTTIMLTATEEIQKLRSQADKILVENKYKDICEDCEPVKNPQCDHCIGC